MDKDLRDKPSFKKAKYHWQVKRSRNLQEKNADGGPSTATNSPDCNMETDSTKAVGNGPMGNSTVTGEPQDITEDSNPGSSCQATGADSVMDKDAERCRGVKRHLSGEDSAHSAPRVKHSVVWKRRNLIISSDDRQDSEGMDGGPQTGDLSDSSTVVHTVPHIDRWQNLHIASAMVDNAINTTLEEIHASVVRASSGQSPSVRHQQQALARGVDVAIQEHGLRAQAGAGQAPTSGDPHRGSTPDLQPQSTISSLFSARCFKQMEDEYRAKVAAQSPGHSSAAQGTSRQRIRVSMLREALGLSGSSNPVNPETEGKVEVTFTRVVPLQKRRMASQGNPVFSSEVSQDGVTSSVVQEDSTKDTVAQECDSTTRFVKDAKVCHHEDDAGCSDSCDLSSNMAPNRSITGEDARDLGAGSRQDSCGATRSATTLAGDQQGSAASIQNADMIPAAEKPENHDGVTHSGVPTASLLPSDRSMQISSSPPDPTKVPNASFVLDQAVNAAILEKGLQFWCWFLRQVNPFCIRHHEFLYLCHVSKDMDREQGIANCSVSGGAPVSAVYSFYDNGVKEWKRFAQALWIQDYQERSLDSCSIALICHLFVAHPLSCLGKTHWCSAVHTRLSSVQLTCAKHCHSQWSGSWAVHGGNHYWTDSGCSLLATVWGKS